MANDLNLDITHYIIQCVIMSMLISRILPVNTKYNDRLKVETQSYVDSAVLYQKTSERIQRLLHTTCFICEAEHSSRLITVFSRSQWQALSSNWFRHPKASIAVRWQAFRAGDNNSVRPSIDYPFERSSICVES